MNPDVAKAIPRLVERGILPPEKAPHLLRVALGDVLSVRRELQALLYLGVLLVTTGVGLLVKENLERIGPATIAAVLGLAAAACFAWVWRVAPPFSWDKVPSPHLAFDYILLLGVLLAAADLAYIEYEFTSLGENWPWHLLLVSVLAGLAAFRFDSRLVFSLALSTFSAWRGVAVAHFGWTVLDAKDAVRWNVIGCGVLFAILGVLLARTEKKAHFEGVATHLGWLLVLGGLASGLADDILGFAWSAGLLLVGAGLAAGAFQVRRFSLFAFGVVAAYVGLSRWVMEGPVSSLFMSAWYFGSSILLVIGLIAAQRRMREPQ